MSTTGSRRRPLGWVLAAVLLGGCAALTQVRCGGAEPASQDRPSGQESALVGAWRGVCAAATEAAAGRLDQADRVFFDRAHIPLHDLAASTGNQDRAVAAELLEAKNRVEATLARRDPAAATELHSLALATGRALTVTGLPDPGRCRAE